MKLLTVLCLALVLFACHGYVVHPGAPNVAASHFYDVLQTSGDLLVEMDTDINTGKLPQSSRPTYNSINKVYYQAKADLKLYSDAVAPGKDVTALLNTLNADILSLNTSIAQINTLLKGVK